MTARGSRLVHLALAMAGLGWAWAALAIASRAARGLAAYLGLGNGQSLLEALFLVFLLMLGYRSLVGVGAKERNLDDVQNPVQDPVQDPVWDNVRDNVRDNFRDYVKDRFVALPARPGWTGEFGVGMAIGWGASLAAVLPLLLSGHLHGSMSPLGGQASTLILFGATLLMATLGEELIFRGYPFYQLQLAIGAWGASVLLAVVFSLALVARGSPQPMATAMVNGTLFGLLLALAWLRTHGLWVGWGLHFGLRGVMAMVLGLPIVGHSSAISLLDAKVSGPAWLTGADYGLDGAWPTGLVLLGAIAVLYRATREWAWHYTHRPIVAAGYAVAIPPPAAHHAMQEAAPRPPALVQILPATPAARPFGTGDNSVPESVSDGSTPPA